MLERSGLLLCRLLLLIQWYGPGVCSEPLQLRFVFMRNRLCMGPKPGYDEPKPCSLFHDKILGLGSSV